MKEKTSAGISGLHFGHMKACAMDDTLTEIESQIANIAYTTGYAPTAWKTGVSVMLKKKDNEDLVTKLRTITLLEADFNFNNKVLSKATIDHAEANNLIAKEQYGSRKHRSAVDHAVHKALTYDIIRQHRVPAALCSNDAKSCYDRVVHAIASLAYQRLGVPKPPVHCMLKTIQRMRHHIRTTFGDSAFTMGSDGSLIPFQGILQGNGASPVTWVLISTPLLNMLREMDNGGHFETAISKQRSHIVGYSYVDDTDLLQVDLRDSTITIEQTIANMQETINRWEGGLKVTGGAIVPHKSFVYPIDFEFNEQGKWRYKQTDEMEAEFTVKDENDNIQPLQVLESNHGQCTLGVVLAPSGDTKDTVEFLRKKTDNWAAYIQTGHISKQDAWQALDSTIMKTIQYPAAALCLTEKECKYIMAPVLQVCLPKSSIARTYPHQVVYGPKEEGGLGQFNLYTKQGTTKIALLAEHLALQTMTGDLLRCSIEAAKVEVGVGRNIFELNYDLFGPLCSDSIVKFIWKFAYEHNIRINDNVTPNLQLKRRHDVFLMEQIAYEDFTPSELQHINRCRLHLQVTTLADIMDGHGQRIEKLALNCLKNEERPHYYKWPSQPRPHQRVRQIWKRALKKAFPRRENSLILQHTLGEWTENGNDWKWYLNPITKILYRHRQEEQWLMHRYVNRAGRVGNYPRYRYMARALQRPNVLHRATVRANSNNEYTLTGWADEPIAEPPTNPPMDTPLFLRNVSIESMQPKYIGNTPPTRARLAEALQNGTLRIVSDGSFMEEHELATAGFVAEDFDRTVKLKCTIRTPGEAKEMNSYRAELSGIIAAIGYVKELSETFNVQQGQYQLGCDGKGALSKLQYHISLGLFKTKSKHFDMIETAIHYTQHSNININFTHIKGHQDDDIPYKDLDRNAQLNVQADKLAKKRMTEEIRDAQNNGPTPNTSYLPFEPCVIQKQDRQGNMITISSELETQLQQMISSDSIREYWSDKGKFTEHTEKYIDWKVTGKAFKSLSKGRRNQVSKWLTGFCGVGKMLVKYRHQTHSRCPRCNEDNEDVAHILQCNHNSAKALWDQEVTKLQQWMIENDGEPNMVQAIIENINAWRSQYPYPATRYDNRTLRSAIRHQDEIGWQNFIEGFKDIGWRKVQMTHFQHINSQKSVLLWMSRLQQKLWNIMKAMWTDRNNTLHHEGNTVHQHEMQAITAEILIEWQIGIDILPNNRYEHLFRGNVQTRLNDTIHQKQMWLSSVWGARDKYGSTRPTQRDIVASSFYRRWKERLQFQKENKLVNEEIIAEWNIGLHTLDLQHDHFFMGSLNQCLAKKLHIKKRWICRIWEVRDREGDQTDRQRNPIVVSMYNRWRQQLHQE